MAATTFVPGKKKTATGDSQLALWRVFEAGKVSTSPAVTPIDGGLQVGREVPAPGITIADDGVMSRLHMTFSVDNSVVVVDRSTNGTFVNGMRLTAPVALNDRDVIRAGESLFVVRTVDERKAPDPPLPTLRGISREVRRLRSTVTLMAPTASTVLLLGETGTGKEVVARAVHEHSGRTGPFIAINCAAIPDTLAESQLFGHVVGAFTGATRAATGAFQAARGGTLLLDEIGELSPAVQAKLLRVLETNEITPVGSSESVRIDARVVCATHQDLVKRTRTSAFRGDLYARIAELVIRLPPLHDRREDVLLLLTGFLPSLSPPLSVELAERLLLHPWPFNVRELKKLAAELALHASAETLELDHVADRLQETASLDDDDDETSPAAALPLSPTSPSAPQKVPTRDELQALLTRHQGNIVRIAKESGRSRKSVYRWMEMHGFDVADYRGAGSADEKA